MLAFALAADIPPSIEVSLVPGDSADAAAFPLRALAPSLQEVPVSPSALDSLVAAVFIDTAYLDLSDTGGTVSGDPDTPDLAAYLVPNTELYVAEGVTIDTLYADAYVSWDSGSSQWTITICTMGGLSWTGLGSTSASDPLGVYTTATHSEAGSGYVVLS